jgi:LuxR family maltose regulon positive regulatory protein
VQQRVLTTKLHIPTWRAGNIARPHLVELAQAGLAAGRRLTLISAPAGYGKTTLMVEWAQSLPVSHQVAWLALDEADNQPPRFFAHWLAALSRAYPDLVETFEPFTAAPHFPPLTAILDAAINALVELDASLLLVLDDYHILTNTHLHEAIAYFIEHQPASVHLALTTRIDPPLPLARLRASGEMTEIRSRQLRFSTAEVQTFFAQVMALDLDAETIHTVEARTEGWAAGLQLAGLALQNLSNWQAFVSGFHGSHRYVLDYLAEEVVRQLGVETRQFLIQTAVLSSFNAELCESLTGRADSQAILHHLEQANLFLVPLDNERIWYRYHHLFADYLRTHLTKEETTALCKKASVWYETNGLGEEAVHYALACADVDFAADVVARALQRNTTWSGGNVALLTAWLGALPAHVYDNRPQLSLDASRIHYLAGQFDLAEERIDRADDWLQAHPATANHEQMLAMAALYRGAIASVRGDIDEAIAQTSAAQARLDADNHLVQARGFFSLGLAYELADQSELAVQNFLQSSKAAQAADVRFLAIHARCAAAQVQIAQGRLRRAEATCRAAIELAEGMRLAPVGLAWSILGGIAVERNDLEKARQWLTDGIALSRQGGLIDDVILGLVHLARLHAVQSEPSRAQATINEVTSLMRSFDVPRMAMRTGAQRARLQIFLGEYAAAAQWAARYQAERTTPAPEFEELTLVRVLLASGETASIQAILEPLLERAQVAGRGQSVMETMLLLSLFHRILGNTQSALTWLEQALHAAAPEGYTRIFLDEGDSLLDLLPRMRHAEPELVDRLLGAKAPAAISPTAPAAPLVQLPEALSEQEQRVLQLIIAGKSNREIAAELVIAVGTAKWHVHNVLQKLGVSNRPQAIARARALGFG